MTEATCPWCSIEMAKKDDEVGPVSMCPSCGDVMVNPEIFSMMLGVELPPLVFGEETARTCPYCHKHMSSIAIHDVGLEGCKSCGILHSDTDSMRRISGKAKRSRPEGENHRGKALIELDAFRNTENAMRAEKLDGFRFDGMFVLYRNGVLIDSFTNSLLKDIDRDVMGSMMTAITDFVETSFTCFGPDAPLESIRFRGREIAFEKRRFLVVVVVVKNLDPKTRETIGGIIEGIEKRHASVLDGWNGDLGTLRGISTSLHELAGPGLA